MSDKCQVDLDFIPLNKSILEMKKKNKINVLLYFFDGFSRFHFIHMMNNTINTLNKFQNRKLIKNYIKYHAIGFNSPPNYLSLFYGRKFKKKMNKSYSLFNIFNNNGYITIGLTGYCDKYLKLHGNPTIKGVDHEIDLGCHPDVNKYMKILLVIKNMVLLVNIQDVFVENK